MRVAGLAPVMADQLEAKNRSTCGAVLQLSVLELSELVDCSHEDAADALRSCSLVALPPLHTVHAGLAGVLELACLSVHACALTATRTKQLMTPTAADRLQHCRQLRARAAAATCPQDSRRAWLHKSSGSAQHWWH